MGDSTLFDRSRLRARPSGPPELASSVRTLAIESAPVPRGVTPTGAAAPWLQAPAHEPVELSHPPSSLFDELTDAVLRFDRRLVVVYANPAAERAMAISRAAFIGRPLNHVEHFTQYAPLWEAKLAATFDSLDARSFKFAYAHPAGSKNFEVRLVLEFDAQGEVSFVTAIVHDVTVPRTALRATRAADAMLSTLMSSARIGMAVLDGNLRYTRCNTYLAQLLGVEVGQLLGRRLDQAFDHSSQPAVMRSLERMRSGELRVPQQIEYEFAGGDRPWVRERRTPLFGPHGGFSGVFLTVERLDRERFAETSLAALRQALDSAGEMVLEIGRDGAILDANETALAWLGYGREQLTGLRLGSIDASLTDERFAEMIESLLGRGAFHGEARYRTRLGSEFEVDLVLQRVEHGEREFIFLLVRDISDRKRIEVELAENAERLATIFNESPVGILQLDPSFRIRRANRAACALLGYREHDLLGRDPVRLMHPDDVVASLKQRERLMEYLPAGAALVSEPDRRLLDREGRTVWVKLGWRALGSGDASRRYLLVMENFTDQKLFEGQLRSALREQQSLLETMSTGVVKTRDGQVVVANREFGRMFGYTDAEAIGMSLWQLCLHRDGQMPEDVPGLPAVRPGLTTSAEVVLYGRDGRPRWCLVQARPLDDAEADAAPAEAIFTFQDFTELRQQREAAARAAAELQSLLAESRLIFDTALVGLLFVRDGRLVRANAAMEDLLGCETGTLVDQIQLFAHPSDRMLLASLEERFETIRSAGACEFELLLYRRRSDPIWVAVQGRAVNRERPELGYIFAFVNIDERKRSERELRSALNELQLIFDNALVAILYVANDLVVKCNAAAERMFGFSAPDLRELQFGTLFADPADWSGVQADWIGAAAGGSATFEHQMRRADASVFWCAGNVRPLEEEERGVIVTLMDVDARHRSEDELRTMRNYLDLVIENLPVLVSVRDVKTGRFISLNRAGESMTGLTRHQVIGRTWHEVYGRQFADLYREMDRRAIADGHQIERPRDVMLRADGRTLIVNQRVVPVFDGAQAEQQSASYVMSIVDDLTDEVRAETALRETETRFRQFAENIDQLVFIANADLTHVLYVNSRYAQLVGTAPSELMDNPRNALRHVHFDDAARLAHQLPRVIAGLRRLRRGELTVRVDHPSGGVRTISVRLNPARMHDGQLRVFGVAEDVTARMAAEQQRLEDAVRQRDILVREVHHRIKNNLQGVAGLLQHMASGKPEVAPQLNEIAGQIQAIAQVHGLQIGAAGTLPVLGVVQGIFSNLGVMFGVEVRLAPSASALWRWGLPEGEAVPLALVINELGTNAIKYRESRDLTLDVRIESRPDGLAVRIQNAGRLPAGFDLARISSGVSGLGLIKALLPRRGAHLTLEQEDDRVMATLDLSAPAVREDL
ncbi:MAG TPA: PAS domain S-box protein, partial [Burkholderiaceae bacterium]|nr:PAS domain S-box protein [Burkholderiaceae bacterium]